MRHTWLVALSWILSLCTVCEHSCARNNPIRSLTKFSSNALFSRIRLLYVVSRYSQVQRNKIDTLCNAFGDNLIVIWGSPQAPCPYSKVKCESNLPVSKRKKRMSKAGIEKALIWAVKHKTEYDYVWIMESDVHFTNIDILRHVVYVQSSSDYLSQNENKNCQDLNSKWDHRAAFLKKWEALGLARLCFHGLQNLFRLSTQLVDGLNNLRLKNNGNWLLHEGLIPTAVRWFNMTESLWRDLCGLPHTLWSMRYRPCHSQFPVPGIYRPVRYDTKGRMVVCTQPAMPWKELSNIRHKKSTLPQYRILYIESRQSVAVTSKIMEMHNAFGDDLVVIWDSQKEYECPFLFVKCVWNVAVTKSREWSLAYHAGFGHEKAMMWAVEHMSEYDYIWTMESDVYYTDIDLLKKVIYISSSSDFLTQNEVKSCSGGGYKWYWADRFMEGWEKMGFPRKCFYGLHSLFRMSEKLVSKLNENRLQLNKGNWLYYEALIPTTIRQFDMTESLWKELCSLPQTFWTMRYRPCHTSFKQPGIYHPVKHNDDNKIIDCTNASRLQN